MEDKMSAGNGWRFAIGLVLVVALILGAAAIGYAAYSAGISAWMASRSMPWERRISRAAT